MLSKIMNDQMLGENQATSQLPYGTSWMEEWSACISSFCCASGGIPSDTQSPDQRSNIESITNQLARIQNTKEKTRIINLTKFDNLLTSSG